MNGRHPSSPLVIDLSFTTSGGILILSLSSINLLVFLLFHNILIIRCIYCSYKRVITFNKNHPNTRAL